MSEIYPVDRVLYLFMIDYCALLENIALMFFYNKDTDLIFVLQIVLSPLAWNENGWIFTYRATVSYRDRYFFISLWVIVIIIIVSTSRRDSNNDREIIIDLCTCTSRTIYFKNIMAIKKISTIYDRPFVTLVNFCGALFLDYFILIISLHCIVSCSTTHRKRYMPEEKERKDYIFI